MAHELQDRVEELEKHLARVTSLLDNLVVIRGIKKQSGDEYSLTTFDKTKKVDQWDSTVADLALECGVRLVDVRKAKQQ